MQVTYRRIMKLHPFNTGVTYWLICPIFLSAKLSCWWWHFYHCSAWILYGSTYKHIWGCSQQNTNSTVSSGWPRQIEQWLDFFFFPHFTSLFKLFNILIPWDSGCEQGGKPKVVSRCDASMFSLYPRKGNTASLGKRGNVCCFWCRTESWDSKTQVLLPCCPCDLSKAQVF